MKDFEKEISDEKLTQADLIKLMLHNAQHMATREEVKSDINELKNSSREDMGKLDQKIERVEASLKEDISKLDQKIDRVEASLKEDISKLDQKINNVEASLKEDISKLDQKIDKVELKIDRFQWLIIVTILTVLLKDYVFSLIK